MKSSIFDKNTGEFMWHGPDHSTKYDKLVTAGHIAISGVYGGPPNYLKYDFATGTTVPDIDRINDKAQQGQDKKDKAIRIDEIKVLLEANYGDHTGTKDQETIDLLNELARI
jgi:hypothetical protein